MVFFDEFGILDSNPYICIKKKRPDMFSEEFYESTLTFENPNPETLEDIYGKDWDSEEEDFDWRNLI